MTREWYFNDGPFREEVDRRVTYSDNAGTSLFLSKTIESDIGTYECKIRTLDGHTLAVARHILGIKPYVTKNKTSDVMVLEGQTAKLTCDITGNPPPAITWHKVILMTKFTFIFDTGTVYT